MPIYIALVGNPNSGKSTMFNVLTGSNQYIGNRPGVTVEQKISELKTHKGVYLIDLPGVYSLSPYTQEEHITRNYLLENPPDVIINIIDATNIERSLNLTTQLSELGIPIIIALNMIDIANKNGDKIDIFALSSQLSCKIVCTSSTKRTGLAELCNEAITIAKEKDISKNKVKININNIEKNNNRSIYVKSIVEKCVIQNKNNRKISNKIDKIITNKYIAIPIFLLVICSVYYISIQLAGTVSSIIIKNFITDFSNGISIILTSIGVSVPIINLFTDGIIEGVGSVLCFIPQLACLFFMLAILEDCGYMSRVAFVMDRLFRKFGLSGKSFIPLLVASGCGVPGIMSCRTIESEAERRITIMVTTFVPCGAKLPVISLIASSLFGQSAIIGIIVYFIGIIMAIISGVLLKKLHIFSSFSSSFITELPDYRMPYAKNVLKNVWNNLKAFIIKAGTVILLACIVIWFLSNLSLSLHMTSGENSILSHIGRLIAPIFAPLGFGKWQMAVATITGIVAKENIVSSLNLLCGPGGNLSAYLSALSSFSFLIFNMLCPPCIAAIAAIRQEMKNTKWTVFALLYQTALAYSTSFIIFQLGSFILNL